MLKLCDRLRSACAEVPPRGFTLVELVVSMSIIGLIATLFVVNYRATERQYRLNAAMDQLVSDVRLVQSYALGAQKHNGQMPAGGWGIYFSADSGQYQLFADSGAANLGTFDPGNGDVVVKTVALPSDIRVDGAAGGLTLDNAPTTQVAVTFLPPDPKTKLYGDGGSGSFLAVELKDETANRLRKATINSFGLVDLP